MSDYLSKPVKRKALEAMLVRWLYDETYRQELSRWFPPPAKQLLLSPTPSPILESESPISARPPLSYASESVSVLSFGSTGGKSHRSDATVKNAQGKVL
jgi:hypothetical protein